MKEPHCLRLTRVIAIFSMSGTLCGHAQSITQAHRQSKFAVLDSACNAAKPFPEPGIKTNSAPGFMAKRSRNAGDSIC